MNILHVIPSLAVRTGGPAFSATFTALGSQQLGNAVRILATDQGGPAHISRGENRIGPGNLPTVTSQLNVSMFSVPRFHRWSYSPDLKADLTRTVDQTDIIHAHSLYLYPQYAAWKVSSQSNIPYVVSPRGSLDPYLRTKGKWRKALVDRWWQRSMLDSASAIHCTSECEAASMVDLGHAAPIVVVPNPLELTTFSKATNTPSSFRQNHLDGFSGPLILNHGRISSKKGLDLLISAMPAIRAQIPGARLAIVGPDDDNLGAVLRFKAIELDLANAVSFVGVLQDSELAGAIADGDIWVLPSHGENFGLAVVEAMATGIPVVTSSFVNIAPAAADVGALIMIENSSSEIASVLSYLLSNPDICREFGRRGADYAQQYDWRKLAPAYQAMYENAIQYHQRGNYNRSMWQLNPGKRTCISLAASSSLQKTKKKT